MRIFYIIVATVMTQLAPAANARLCSHQPDCISDPVERVKYTLDHSGSGEYCQKFTGLVGDVHDVELNTLIYDLSDKIGKIRVAQITYKQNEICMLVSR